MQATKIEYLTHTWNPIVMRCRPVSRGCDHCWHLGMADRLSAMGNIDPAKANTYLGLHPPILDKKELTSPPGRKKPAIIGVQFMGDLFHVLVPDISIDEVFSVMAQCQQHTFILLTKRPDRMRKWADTVKGRRPIPGQGVCTGGPPFCMGTHCPDHDADVGYCGSLWPLPNVVLGVSVEDQETANKRIPILLQTPAACRAISLEPMLEPVSFARWMHPQIEETAGVWGQSIDWVIMGCESGQGCRPMNIEWAQSVKDQCFAAGVPLFYKQGPGDNGYYGKMPLLNGQRWDQTPF